MISVKQVQPRSVSSFLTKVRIKPFLIAEGVIVLALVVSLVFFLDQAWQIFHYPYETDSWEGLEYISSLRLASAKSCYGWPSQIRPVQPFSPYPPFYIAVCALIEFSIKFFCGSGALGLWIGRLVSLVSAFGSAAIIFLVVWNKTKQFLPALIASLFLFGVEPYHRHLDIFRADALGLFLSLLALWSVGNSSSRIRSLFAPFVVLATLTKQPFLMFGLAGVLYTFGRNRREAFFQAATIIAVLVLVSLGLNDLTSGAFLKDTIVYQSIVVSDTNKQSFSAAHSFLDYGGRLITWSLFIQIIAVGYTLRHWQNRYQNNNQWLIAYPIILICVLTTLVHWGPAPERLLPAVPIYQILFGFGLAELAVMAESVDLKGSIRLTIIPLLTLTHLICHPALTEGVLTSNQARKQNDQVSAICAQAHGPVLTELYPMAVLSVKPDAVMGLVTMKHRIGRFSQKWLAQLRIDIQERHYGLIVFSTGFGPAPDFLPESIYNETKKYYQLAGKFPLARVEIYRRP